MDAWRALCLLALVASAAGVNDNTVMQKQAAYVHYQNINTNYRAGSGSGSGMIFVEGSGSLTSVRRASFLTFDFSASAPNANRFCAIGTPQLVLNYRDDGFGCLRPPTGSTTMVLDATTAGSWDPFQLTYANMPSLASYQARFEKSTGYGGCSPDYNYWCYLPFDARVLNTAVRVSTTDAAFRYFYISTTLTCWETSVTDFNYRPKIIFDYITCDPNATCDLAGGGCTCNSGYTGNGVSCTLNQCSSTSMGNANFYTTNVGTTATGQCLPTFGSATAPTAQCQLGGIWGQVSLSCTKLKCPTDSGVGGAQWTIVDAGTTATGTCLPGYAPGNPTRACDENGQWSAAVTNACIRLKCPVATIGNANYTSADSMTSGVSGTCIAGYGGSPKADCTAGGTWDLKTACTRNVCSGRTENGITWPSTDSFGTATGSCQSGYIGAPQRVCTATGEWSDTVVGTCTRVTCASLTEDGNANWPATGAGDTATGACISGFSGAPKRTCSSAGEWGSISQPCTRNLCGADHFDNAQWPAATLSNSLATGTCDSGFYGQPTRTCDANGQWSQTVFNPCIRLTCDAGRFDNAIWPQANANDVNILGTCVTAEGYTGQAVRDCLATGVWGDLKTPCGTVQCGATTDATTSWPSATYPETVVGNCLPGWTGSPSRSCTVNGVFGTITNPCTRKKCPEASIGAATWLQTDAESVNVLGTCTGGWQGAPTRTCDINGAWETPAGVPCSQIFCPADVDNDARASWGQAAAGSADVAGTCQGGYNGYPTRDCNIDGTWGEVVNPCSVDPCPALTNNNNANWPKAGEVGTVSGTCVLGFVNDPANPPRRSCEEGGVWGPVTQNPCIPLNCTQGTNFLSFNAEWPLVVQAGTKNIAGTCLAGYEGSPKRDCSLNGEWTSASPGCTPIKCPTISDDGQHMRWPEAVAGDNAVQGVCLLGYGGAPTRACTLTGQWGAVSNPCTRNRCSNVTFASATWPETLGTETATGTCLSGFVVDGSSITRLCNVNGTWEGVTGACIRRKCPTITEDNIIWTSVDSESTATGQCATGYNSASAPTRPCQASGSWGSVTGTCTRLKCVQAQMDDARWPETNSMTFNVTGTCDDGFEGSPMRDCLATGFFSSPVRNPCMRKRCSEFTDSVTGIHWAQAQSGATGIVGNCPAGSTGGPTRACKLDGTWDTVSGECTAVKCSSVTAGVGNVLWPETSAGGTVLGTCSIGFTGSPSRTCLNSGTWSDIANPCVPLVCASIEDGSALWNATTALQTAAGSCLPTFSGEPTRECLANGTWGDIASPCEPLYCPIGTLSNANWLRTRAGTLAAGTCVSGYVGTPSRACLANGAWSPTVNNPCTVFVPDCPGGSIGTTYFPSTGPGTNVTGTCGSGFTHSAGGPPVRTCFANGTWEDGFANACVMIEHESSGSIVNLTSTAKTASTVTLSWAAANLSAEPTFRVEFATDTTEFAISNLGDGTDIKVQTFVVTGLSPYTTYHFRVSAGDGKGYNTVDAALISVKTHISPPSQLRLDKATTDALRFSWTPSPQAQFYRIYYQRVGSSSRAVTDGFTLYSEVPATNGSAEVGDLEGGTTYEILVLGGRDNETEATGARLRMTTQSLTENVIVDPGLGDNGNIIAGASAGAVILFLILLTITIILIRRRQRRTKAIIDEFGGAEALNTLRSYRETLSRSRGSMTHADSTTHLSHADKTVVNTVMEVALPGFLQMDFESQVRTTTPLSSGGAGIVYKGTLMDPHVAHRVGTDEIVIKEVVDNPALTEEENGDRFHQEVSLMWSLSFHPNVITLVGYTDTPRTIITRLYATDLYRYLHRSENSHVPLDSALMLHLGSGISSGLNAIHSMQIAHRDMKAPNILLQAPPPGEMYPNAVICDFGLARSADDASLKKSSVVKGFSPRYAAPEVFVRAHIQGSHSTIEEDKASDVYAFGVILWEMYTRTVPWGDMNNDEIEMNIRASRFLIVPPPPETDTIRVVFAGVMQACMHPQAERRPLMQVVNNKVCSLLSE